MNDFTLTDLEHNPDSVWYVPQERDDWANEGSFA